LIYNYKLTVSVMLPNFYKGVQLQIVTLHSVLSDLEVAWSGLKMHPDLGFPEDLDAYA